MKKPLVSVVSICWNRRDDILESIEGIYKTTYQNIEIIVVDNNSQDGTAKAIRDIYPYVNVIELSENIGIEAYNIGFKNANGEYIVILDDDSFPEKSAISKMVEKFENDDSLGMVAFDVRNFYRYDELIDDNSEINEIKAESSKYTLSFNGAGAGIRKNLFEEIGFYPGEFFLYCNELDTAFRILDTGYKIIFFSDIVSYHKFSPKNRSSKRAPFYHVRNAFWVIWKNYPLNCVVKQSFKLIYLCFYNSMEQHTLVYIHAMIKAFLQAGPALKKRKVVKKSVWENLRTPLEFYFTQYR